MTRPPVSGNLETWIEASVTTPAMVVQLATHVTPTPCDFTLVEAVHTIALQRQMHDSFSVGRFEAESASGDFHDIGRVMFVPAGIPLHIRAERELTHTFRCLLRPKDFDALTGGDLASRDMPLEQCLNIKQPTIRAVLLQMAREIDNPGFETERLILGLGEVLLVELARYLRDSPAAGAPMRGGLARAAYRKIVERIEAEGPTPNVPELARLAGLSERHMMRAFKQSTGMTIHQHIDEARFKRATLLLGDPARSIAGIAALLGFQSPSAFATAFRRWSGQSPTGFRRKDPVSPPPE